MSNLSNVNVNGTKYVIKDKMLNDSGFYTEQAAFSTLNLTADATADNCKLKADGTSASDSSYRLRKYRVNDGEIVYVNLSKDSDGVCQFQNNTNVPSSSNTYIVGDVVTNAVNAYLPVPSGVTYLIVSELKTNSTNIVGLGVNRIEQASCDIDTMQTGYIAIESGSYKDGNGLIKVKNVNRLRNVAPVCVHDLAAVRFPSGYSAWCFYFDKTLTYIGFSNAWLTGTVPVSTFASGTEYITFGIKNNSTPNSDISSEASTVANGITLKQGKLDVDVLPYAVQHDYNEVIKSVSRIADGLTVPHQSIVGFTTAYKYGFRAMLCDLRFTSDNVPVLEHDAYLNQHYSDVYLNGSLVTANTVEIASTTYENLLQYDFGYYKGSAYANTRIMTFEQMLDLCKKLGCEVHIETKTDLTSTQYGIVFGLIRQYGMEKKTVWKTQLKLAIFPPEDFANFLR